MEDQPRSVLEEKSRYLAKDLKYALSYHHFHHFITVILSGNIQMMFVQTMEVEAVCCPIHYHPKFV